MGELRPYWRAAAAVLVLTTLAFLIGYDSILAGSPAFTHERTAYQEIAETLVRDGVYGYAPAAPTAFRPPLYPLFLALHMQLLGEHWVLGVKLTQGLLLVVTGLLLVRVLAHLTGNGRVMLIGAGLYAGFLPLHAQMLGKNELPVFLVLLLGIVNVLLVRAHTSLGVTALGILAGLAHLTRPSGALFAMAAVGALGYASRSERLGQRLRRVALFAVVFCATLLPWQIRNHREFGVWTWASSSTSGMNLLKGNNASYTQTFPWITPDRLDPYLAEDHELFPGDTLHKVEFTDAARWQQIALSEMLAAPGRTLGWVALKGAAFISPISIPLGSARIARDDTGVVLREFQPANLLSQAIYALYTCLAYLGIATAIRNWTQHSAPQRAMYVFLATFAALLVAAHAVSYPLTRYRLPLDLLLLIPSACWLHSKLPSAQINRA